MVIFLKVIFIIHQLICLRTLVLIFLRFPMTLHALFFHCCRTVNSSHDQTGIILNLPSFKRVFFEQCLECIFSLAFEVFLQLFIFRTSPMTGLALNVRQILKPGAFDLFAISSRMAFQAIRIFGIRRPLQPLFPSI